ncbi:DNA helicase [Tanacetum coccineum]
MKWKRKLLPKTNNVESSENPISIPSDLDNHDESLHTSIPSDLDNHDESSHIRPMTEPCNCGQDSASGCLKRKLPASNSCDAFSRYPQLCGRNVLAKCSLDVPPFATYSNFGVVEHSDLEPSFNKPLRLNVTEGVGPSHDRAHLNAAAEEVSCVNEEGCSSRQPEDFDRVGGIVLNVHKKRQRNIPVVESPSKRVRQTAPRATNRRSVAVMCDDGEGCSSGQGRGRTYAYADLGDCDQQCHHCGAAFWFGEHLKGHSNYRRPEYYLCCGGGQTYMQPSPDPPEYFKNLLENKYFMENIRAYNQMFSMTSFGAKVYDSINRGRYPYVFKVSGQIYHWIGSLCPPPGESSRFLQLYIYDTDHEVENRLRHFGGIDDSDLDPDIVEGLIHFLDAHNQLVQLFRTSRDKCGDIHVPEFKIRLYNAEGARGYELSTSNTLGAVVFDNGVTSSTDFDIIIQEKDGPPKRINKLHKSYMSLQFPLLFIYGQVRFHTELKLRAANGSRQERLFQQYVVGVFCAIEQNRLDFIRKKQKDIRGDHLSGLYDAISRGERDGYEVGGRIILPMSFTGGPRYMYAHYLDALAICQKLGNPKFFITFTCNVNWPEIKRKNFGEVTGVLYTVEFQKRGLPHCHTLPWVDSESKIKEAQDVDRFISAELPDPEIDPQGYRVVFELMMHGPCGAAKMSAPYMKDNICVVPYNRALILAFEAHINVEYYGWSMLIKYLFKYNSKGIDIIFALVSKPLGESSNIPGPSRPPIEKIQNYLEGRFVCAHEAYWRILKFDIHRREPVVQILAVHLRGMQRITFRDRDKLEFVVNLPSRTSTTLTEWFAYNEANQDGRHLTYQDFPSEFVWYDDQKIWTRRHNSKSSIGRLAYVHPTSDELFYFRMLLYHKKGCTEFIDVQTINDVFYPTCRAACEALDLLGDDKEWDIAMQEASVSAMSSELRFVFSHILIHNYVTNPSKLWRKYYAEMGHDIPRRVSERDLIDMLANRLLMEEKNYNQQELMQERDESVPKLNTQQRKIYDLIIDAKLNKQQELIFLYGHGGTGKTFLWKTIISTLRSEEKIGLAVASSGIASLLLPSITPRDFRSC